MSKMGMAPLHVDVLVSAGLHGPLEADYWRSIVDDADEVGRKLLGSAPPGAAYHYTPITIPLTAAEILCACDFYNYNHKASAYVTRLRRDVTPWIAGWREAPWGWTDHDVRQRRGRAVRDGAPALDPRLEAVVQRFAAEGIELDASEEVDRELRQRFPGGVRLPIVGIGRAFPFGTGGMAPLTIILADDPEASQTAWLHSIGRLARSAATSQVWQWGNLIVATQFGRHQEAARERVVAILNTWPNLDRTWTNNDPPRQRAQAVHISRNVEMHGQLLAGRTFVARTAKEQSRLLDRLKDQHVREELAAVDIRKHSIVVLVGIDDIGEVESLDLNDVATEPPYGLLPITELAIRRAQPQDPSSFGTAIVCERLEVMPFRVQSHVPTAHNFARETVWNPLAETP